MTFKPLGADADGNLPPRVRTRIEQMIDARAQPISGEDVLAASQPTGLRAALALKGTTR